MLDKIVSKKTKRIEQLKMIMDLNTIAKKAEKMTSGNIQDKSLYSALKDKEGLSIIAEIKKASPSKGLISKDFRYMEYAKAYNQHADAISVLTEEDYFMGSVEYLTNIKKEVTIPVLRKDFIIDAYQIYESKVIGADAILLICGILSQSQLDSHVNLARNLGLDCLVEVHDERDIHMALRAGADIIGINNRNLKTFRVDICNTERLIRSIPPFIVKVSESGIHTREDMAYLEKAGADAVLIGEAFMRAENIENKFVELRGRHD